MSLMPTPTDNELLAEKLSDTETALKVSRFMISAMGLTLLCWFAGPPFFHMLMVILLWMFGTSGALKAAAMVHTHIGMKALARENLRQIASKSGPE